mgnify:CR=1 FL=1
MENISSNDIASTDEVLSIMVKRIEKSNVRLEKKIQDNQKAIEYYRGKCTHSETEEYLIYDQFGYDEIEYTCKFCGKKWRKMI